MAEVTRTILADIGLWLWRLVPANPIVLRVVSMGSKRAAHFWARTGYLLVMLFVVLLVQVEQPGCRGFFVQRAAHAVESPVPAGPLPPFGRRDHSGPGGMVLQQLPPPGVLLVGELEGLPHLVEELCPVAGVQIAGEP